MIYILEGIDRNGKSTLAEEFKKLGYHYVFFGKVDFDPYDMHFNFITNELPKLVKKYQNIVLDRSYFSELVYGSFFRNKHYYKLDKYDYLDKFLNTFFKVKIVYCQTDINTNWQLIQKENKKEIITFKKLETLRNKLNNVLANSCIDKINYDFKTNTINDILNKG